MRYLALATDYDGTLAHAGVVSASVETALDRFRAAGGKLVLITGRVLPDLLDVFPRADQFDLIVAENGALLYWPATRAERLLAEPPPPAFARDLRARGVEPLSCGRVIVATLRPHERAVEAAIREQGLALKIIFNKDSLMVLPAGVDKAGGLRAALADLGIAPERVAGVGDAENDLAFMRLCGCAVAVANALPEVKARADRITAGAHGDGVAELIDSLLCEETS